MNDKKEISLPLVMADTKSKIVSAINESHLPFCILQEILTNITYEVTQKAQIELQNIKEQD